MKIIGILLLILGVIGLLMGMMMFGDIGIACIVGGSWCDPLGDRVPSGDKEALASV